jgi:predicted enzyme related to lactoylglutathione lyase
MRFGVYVPNFGEYADPERLLELARDAESARWEGFFLYDHIVPDAHGCRPDDAIVDPWIALAAIAAVTERIRLGPLVTALARRRPWKLAREVASLDHLSRGRVVLGVGLGGRPAFESFGEEADERVRAQKLDEALEILVRLWSAEPTRFEGRHLRVNGVRFLPAPLQRPRPPVWVAGIWPGGAPFRRAARFDGVFPLSRTGWETRASSLPTPRGAPGDPRVRRRAPELGHSVRRGRRGLQRDPPGAVRGRVGPRGRHLVARVARSAPRIVRGQPVAGACRTSCSARFGGAMKVKKLRQVFVVAEELERAVRFWQGTLGLELAFRDGERWVQFEAGGVSFALASAAEGQGAPPGVPVPVFEVEDLDAALSELRAAGAVVGALRDMGAHGRTAAAIDPGGARIVLFQRA